MADHHAKLKLEPSSAGTSLRRRGLFIRAAIISLLRTVCEMRNKTTYFFYRPNCRESPKVDILQRQEPLLVRVSRNKRRVIK